MDNIFRYIKINDINPSLRIYHSDTETDAEENLRLLSSEDEIQTTDDEKYDEEMRRDIVLSEIDNLKNENYKINKKLVEAEEILIEKTNDNEKLIITIEQLEKKIKQKDFELLENAKTNKKNIIITCFITLSTSFIMSYIFFKK